MKTLQNRTLPTSRLKKRTRKHYLSLKRQRRRSAKMMMTSLKTTRMKEIPEAKTRKRSVEVKTTLTLETMRQLQSKHRGRRAKRVDVVALTRKLKTPIGVTTTVVLKVRIKVVVIVVATVIAVVTATVVVIVTVTAAKAVELARIRSAEAETRKKVEMVIERRSVVVGMRMTVGTVMPRSVVANAMMLRMTNPLRNLEEGIEIVVTAIVVIVIVATVIVVVIGIGIEVRVKRRGDENEAKQAKKSDLQMRCIYMLPLKVAKDCNTSHQEIFI